MNNKDYDKMIKRAIRKDEVVNLMRGEGEYFVSRHQFECAPVSLNTNAIFWHCFFKQKGKILNIEEIFYDSLLKLISDTANDVYIAVFYLYDCLEREDYDEIPFLKEKEKISKLFQDAIKKNWSELKYGDKYFDMHLIYAWNKNCQKKYGISIAPDLEKMARQTHFDSNDTTIYYERLIKKAVKNNEVIDLLCGEGEYKFRLAQYTNIELIRETTTRLVCCFYMQMGRIKGIDKIFCETLKQLYLSNVKDVFLAQLYRYERSFYEQKQATFYIDYIELDEFIREAYKKYKKELKDGIEFGNGKKIKIPWEEFKDRNSEFLENCAFKFNCHYIPED